MGRDLRRALLELLSSMQGKEVPQSYLHRALNASKSRISEILSELEKEGLIERRVIGRSKIVYVKEGLAEAPIARSPRVLRLGIVYSSEYLFLGYFASRMNEKGYRVEIRVYRDGLEATRSLAEGRIELALSPLVGQLYMYPLYRSYRVIAGGMTGGFKILGPSGESPSATLVYSSRLSTMDYVRSEYVEKAGLEGSVKTMYFKNPEAVANAKGYVVIWHPFYRILEEKGLRDLTGKAGIEVGNCCTLAASNTLSDEVIALVRDAYMASISEYSRNPYRFLEYYSAVTGIPVSILREAVSAYKPSPYIDGETVRRIVAKLGRSVPDQALYTEPLANHDAGF